MLNNLPKQYGYTSWIVPENISGEGTAIVTVATSNFFTGNLPAHAELFAEIEFDLIVTGGTGFAYAWLRFTAMGKELVTIQNASPDGFLYTTRVAAGTTIRHRKIKVDLSRVEISSYQDVDDLIPINIQACGQNADTAWAVTNIKMRLLYKLV